ncbi:MAG TPA: GNAT family N-acetyltransferase [Anaerolineales bacterium]|nr:GNAT family N-acetyltransferase [Anaerolineales bacterium]
MQPQTKLPDGITLRPAALSDVEELTHLINLVAMEMNGYNEIDTEEFETDLKTPGLDLEKDTRVAVNAKGKIVAYQDIFAIDAIPVRPNLFGRVHLDYMNKGIGSHLLEWAIERAKHVIDKVPADARVSAVAWTPPEWQPAVELLTDHAFNPYRHFLGMKIDLDEKPQTPVWPEGITVRTITFPDELEMWFRTYNESFKDHFGRIDQPFEQAFEQFKHFNLNDPHNDPDLWFIAMDGNQPAGILQGRKQNAISPDQGYIHLLGVLRPYRKRGLGLALLLHGFNEFWKRGKKAATLGVDADSLTGAQKLYKKAGMYSYRKTAAFELELRPGKDISNTG